jgi:transcriptional regulator with XRE-family HTH domain
MSANENNEINKRLARMICERRKAVKLSQEDVARMAGVSRSYYSDVERGLRNISVESLLRISLALNVSASSLLELVERFAGELLDVAALDAKAVSCEDQTPSGDGELIGSFGTGTPEFEGAKTNGSSQDGSIDDQVLKCTVEI